MIGSVGLWGLVAPVPIQQNIYGVSKEKKMALGEGERKRWPITNDSGIRSSERVRPAIKYIGT